MEIILLEFKQTYLDLLYGDHMHLYHRFTSSLSLSLFIWNYFVYICSVYCIGWIFIAHGTALILKHSLCLFSAIWCLGGLEQSLSHFESEVWSCSGEQCVELIFKKVSVMDFFLFYCSKNLGSFPSSYNVSIAIVSEQRLQKLRLF